MRKPRSKPFANTGRTLGKPIYEIKLIVELDDPDDIDRLSERVAAVACPAVIEGYAEPHECAVPYMLMTTLLSEKSARSWRDSLNR